MDVRLALSLDSDFSFAVFSFFAFASDFAFFALALAAASAARLTTSHSILAELPARLERENEDMVADEAALNSQRVGRKVKLLYDFDDGGPVDACARRRGRRV
jgi:hypothetical protein